MDSMRMLVSQCDVGIILAEDVKSNQGITLVSKDSVMNQYIIDRVADFGITHVWVYTADVLVLQEELDPENNCNKDRVINSKQDRIITSHSVKRRRWSCLYSVGFF